LKRFVRFIVIVICSLLIAIYVSIYTDFSNEIFWRFESLYNITSDDSWTTRVNRWSENIELFKSSPLLGLGPLSRYNLQYAADNEWLLLLRSYGVLGTLYFLLMFIVPHLRGSKSDYKILTLSILVSASVFMIPVAVFNSLTLM